VAVVPEKVRLLAWVVGGAQATVAVKEKLSIAKL